MFHKVDRCEFRKSRRIAAYFKFNPFLIYGCSFSDVLCCDAITRSAVLVILAITSDGEIARLLLLIHSTILCLEGLVDRNEDL